MDKKTIKTTIYAIICIPLSMAIAFTLPSAWGKIPGHTSYSVTAYIILLTVFAFIILRDMTNRETPSICRQEKKGKEE